MSKAKDIDAILAMLPRPDWMSPDEAKRRLDLSCDARQLRDMRERLESLSDPARQQAAEIGPEGMSLFDKAVREVKQHCSDMHAEFHKFNEQVVAWLASTPEGQEFLARRTA
jgi:hypothetical protein